MNLTTSQMLKVPSFYPLWFAYMFGCIAGTMAVSQAVPFATLVGYSASGAAIAVTVGSAGSALGPILLRMDVRSPGPPLDGARHPRDVDVRFSVDVPSTARQRFFLHAAVPRVLCLWDAVVGLHRAGRRLLRPQVLAANYGILLLAWGTAGIFGPLIGGRSYGATGSYQYACYFACAAAVASLALPVLRQTPGRGGAAGTRVGNLELTEFRTREKGAENIPPLFFWRATGLARRRAFRNRASQFSYTH